MGTGSERGLKQNEQCLALLRHPGQPGLDCPGIQRLDEGNRVGMSWFVHAPIIE
jgi:hypothetical protein